LAVLSDPESRFTTGTAFALTTDLRILKSSLLTLTRAFTTEASSPTAGAESAARLAAAISESVSAKCGRLVCTSAGESAIGWLAEEASDPEESRLSPDWRPIILVRKPLIGTVAANVLAHGTGAINVDGCRIGTTRPGMAVVSDGEPRTFLRSEGRAVVGTVVEGRWPANVCLDEEAAAMLDEQSGERMHSAGAAREGPVEPRSSELHPTSYAPRKTTEGMFRLGDSGGASRFFYTAKASSWDRNDGLEGMETGARVFMGSGGRTMIDGVWVETHSEPRPRANHHPTVKPTDLMRWLCRLVTPPGGLILDPFMGSGSTGVAAVAEGFRFIGIELDPEYVESARRRINAVAPLLKDVTVG
jgi:site-specific DNA-methyltransferase (adenine-specific)